MSLGAILTELGHGLVSWGLGGPDDGEAPATGGPGCITLPRVAPLCEIDLPEACALCEVSLPIIQPLCTIELPRTSMACGKIHVGDIVRIGDAHAAAGTAGAHILTYNSAEELADPTAFTCRVKTPGGNRFSLVYGTASSVEGGDAVIRLDVGTYVVHIEITEERGFGVYHYTIVTTGNVAAEGGSFTVFELAA